MNALPAQNWDPKQYGENARFVSDLGHLSLTYLPHRHTNAFSILGVVMEH
ncbi:MAG: hypothetical protein NPIRA02_12820 [Nitrospirales bacterium]|nr:MAG: hypothetical protein NPIRA02_12820 [Nitrospirales bacterium]